MNVLWEVLPDHAPDAAMLIIGWNSSRTEGAVQNLFAHPKYRSWVKLAAEPAMPLLTDMRTRVRDVPNFNDVGCMIARGDAKRSELAYVHCWVPWNETEEVSKNPLFRGTDRVDPQLCSLNAQKSYRDLLKYTYPSRTLSLARAFEAHEVESEQLLVVILNDDYGGHVLGGKHFLLNDRALCPLVVVFRDALLDDRDRDDIHASLSPKGFVFSRIGGTTVAHRFPSLLRTRRIVDL